MSELGRVTSENLFLTVHRPWLWSLGRRIGGIAQGMKMLGLELPAQVPGTFDLLTHLTQYAKVKTKLAPFPWTVYMTQMRPLREEKLVLAEAN